MLPELPSGAVPDLPVRAPVAIPRMPKRQILRRLLRQILLGAFVVVALAGAVYWLRRVVGPWSESMELISIIRSLIVSQTHGVVIATGLAGAATILAAVLVPVATVAALVWFEHRAQPRTEPENEPEKKL